MDWIICRLSDLGNPGSLGFVLETPRGPVEGFLVRRGDCVRAYRNSCPHTRAPLEWVPNQFLDSSGELIQCSMHGALFLVESGECVHGPCLGAFLEGMEVAVEDGDVRISMWPNASRKR
jgi:nitrite reductase/ring-hydroxylating ferredoxin subunit